MSMVAASLSAMAVCGAKRWTLEHADNICQSMLCPTSFWLHAFEAASRAEVSTLHAQAQGQGVSLLPCMAEQLHRACRVSWLRNVSSQQHRQH